MNNIQNQIASEQDIVTVGRWLTGKDVTYVTAKNIVAIVELFILNNVTPSNAISPTSRGLEISEISVNTRFFIPKHTVRRIMWLLEKTDYAMVYGDGSQMNPYQFEMDFFCIENRLGFWNFTPIKQQKLDIQAEILLRVFAEVIDVIKERGLCNIKIKEATK